MTCPNLDLVELIEGAAEFRDDPPVPRPFILRALQDVADGKVKISRYPNGAPSLLDVYVVAVQLEKREVTQN